MGVRRGGQEEALAPSPSPWSVKIVGFSTFCKENSIFFGSKKICKKLINEINFQVTKRIFLQETSISGWDIKTGTEKDQTKSLGN